MVRTVRTVMTVKVDLVESQRSEWKYGRKES
jgi:hypothetical protein